MNEKCPQCGAKLKESSPKVWGGKDLLMIKFCPKCEYFESYLALIPLIALKGTGLGGSLSDRGVNSASWGLGEFRVRIESPKEDILREKAEIMVKTFPLYFHPTKPPFPAYAELKQGDEVIAAGFLQEREESWLIGVWEKGILVTKEEPPAAPINAAIGHSFLTELQGVGSEFNIYYHMIPNHRVQNVTARIVLPEGLVFLNGTLICACGEQQLWSEKLDENLMWVGDVEEGTWMRFEVTVGAAVVGNWTVIMSVGKLLPDGSWFGNATIYGEWWYGNAMVYGFQISEDSISSWSGDSSLSPYPPCFQYAWSYAGDLKIVWPPIVLNITVSDFTKPEGLNSEANLTVTVTPKQDISNASMKISLPEGIQLVNGNLTWSGNLIANISVALNVRVRIIELGDWHIFANVEESCLESDGKWHTYSVFGTGFIIMVGENSVTIFPPPPIVSPEPPSALNPQFSFP